MTKALDRWLAAGSTRCRHRYYSGRPLIFGNYIVTGNPKLDNPTRDKWFDTSMFAVPDTYTPRNNPSFYDGLNGPGCVLHRHDADQDLQHLVDSTGSRRASRRTTRSTQIVWDNPRWRSANANFGKVTRKRTDITGREIQLGLRFMF